MKNKYKPLSIFFALSLFLLTAKTYSQGAAINTTGANAHPSAMLDVSSDNTGFLLPRMTEAQKLLIQNPAIGLMIFNTTNNCFESFVLGSWHTISCPANCLPPTISNSITGNSDVCISSSNNYSINSTGSATSYTWSLPNGWSILNGQGTNQIDVITGNLVTQSGNVSVTANNNCGSSSAITKYVNIIETPTQPTQITGLTTICAGQTGVIYSVPTIPFATSYIWTLPNGATGSSNTNSISLDFSSSAISDIITVKGTNSICGDGQALSLNITVNQLPSDAGIISGQSQVCIGDNGVTYSTPTISNATSYIWSYSGTGATINGNSESTTINFSSSATSGNLTVNGVNSCGNGNTSANYYITVNSKPSAPVASNHSATKTQITWNWNNVTGAVGYQWNTTNIYPGAGVNTLINPTYTQSGLTCENSYSLYVWSYNNCDYSTATLLTHSTSLCFDCGNENVTFNYNGTGSPSVTYGTVIGQNGRCWLDRNLGALQVATATDDVNAFGDYFQWGRLDDGHQITTSSTTSATSSNDIPGHSNWIAHIGGTYDWREPQNNNLWQAGSNINNPCPNGWRVPTEAEFNTERLSWSSNNIVGAYNSPLKLTLTDFRTCYGWMGDSYYTSGRYWTSIVYNSNSKYFGINSGGASFASAYRGYGYVIRCIKDY